MATLKLGVLGGGVIGVTAAAELQREWPNADVTLIADKFNRETTSDGAAGIFRPGTGFSLGHEETTRTVIRDSYEYYEDIRRDWGSLKSGISQVSGYIFSNSRASTVRNHLLEGVVPVYRRASEEELKLCPGTWHHGSFFTTILTECRRFLPWALARFQNNGGTVLEQGIKKFEDVEGHNFQVVVNCLGLGAKELCNDYKMVPIRGQVLKVSAPWLKNFFYADYDTYIIPGSEMVTLGGCRNYESYDLRVSRHDTAAIWERCTELVPRLKNTNIVREWVGLRPHRDPTRIEPEILNVKHKTVKVVHNYGHGGYGVTAAPGSAKLAVKMVQQLLKSNCKL